MFEVYSLVLFAHVVAVALVGQSLSSARAALREAGTVGDVRRIVACNDIALLFT